MFKRKDGRWQHCINVDGKRIAVSGKTQKECMSKVKALTEKKVSGWTFGEIAEEFAEVRFSELSEGSLPPYRAALRSAVDHFGDYNLEDITPKDINLYLNGLASRLASKTVSNYRTMLNQVYLYAINRKGIDVHNPCASVPTPPSLVSSRERSPLTEEQRQEIDSTKADEFPLAFLIVNTGCRLGEACALQWRDVDFRNGLIHITKSLHWRGNAPYVGRLKTKNGLRDVPLLSPLRDFLKQLPHKDKDAYIVSGMAPLTASQRDSRWIAFCQDHNLCHSELRVWHSHGVPHKHLTWICDIDRHQIRHDFATSLFRAGVPVKSVQHLLGHADYSTTMNIYVHWERQSLEDARSLMENFIAKEKTSV